jgi:hypothetical protein
MLMCAMVGDLVEALLEMNNFRNELDTVTNIASMYY